MSSALIGLVLDIVVLVFLAVTIVYVWRLFKSLNDFKAHRHEFDGVITSLLSSIDQAERSVQTLKQVSAVEAGELDNLIQQSKAMSEELKIINEAGENMAKRLEMLAEKNRKAVQSLHMSVPPHVSEDKHTIRSRIAVPPISNKALSNDTPDQEQYVSTLKNVEKTDVDLPSFMIQDREFDDLDTLESKLDSSASNDIREDDRESHAISDNLQSQAEQELFDALRASKRNVSRRGRS